MKILLSALACEPGKGSELEVGFRAMLGAASQHEVWVLTNKDTIPAVRHGIQGLPEAERIHLEGIDFGVDAEGIELLTIPGFHFYYDRWQRRAASRARQLDRVVDFDVVHHVTLAAYWTRTGVAAIDKPLVWGPVGGGVEPPLRLLRALGWRGLLEDAGRFLARRFLAQFGPARRAQRRAVITFAQNPATLERIRTRGRIVSLTNATAVQLNVAAPPSGPRTRDVLFVGRLVAWKGPMLALRAFRYVQDGGARLVFCGRGYERRRMERAAKRWGIAERVRFEGWLPRDVLLSRLATAGVLLHPALHEEAGLCVAEALALGTPAVCLDHGGPPEILREWPQTPSAAVPPRDPETTARGLAHAIDHFLDQPPPVRAVPQASATSFKHELLAAYDAAIATRGRRSDAVVWAFPRGKPQLFTATPRALSKGVPVYAFGRRIPRIVQTGIAVQIRVPGIRRLVAERHPQIEPICGWDIWDAIAERLQHCGGATSREWIHLHSQWDKPRSSVIALSPRGRPEFFLTIESIDNRPRGPLSRVPSFRVPACIDAFSIADWSVRQYRVGATIPSAGQLGSRAHSTSCRRCVAGAGRRTREMS